MYNKEMLDSMKKVAEAREQNTYFEPRRMTADEKDTLLATFHPDYKEDQFSVLKIGANAGEKVPCELAELCRLIQELNPTAWTFQIPITMLMCLLSAAAVQVHLRLSRLITTAQKP